jgi:aspartate racemase
VAAAARTRGFGHVGVLGTHYLMTGPVYADRLAGFGIAHEIPDAADRERIDSVIFDELVCGRMLDSSRRYLAAVTRRLAARGCDAVVLGCTEIPLLVGDDGDWPLPTLDSTRLLARAALDRALGTRNARNVAPVSAYCLTGVHY